MFVAVIGEVDAQDCQLLKHVGVCIQKRHPKRPFARKRVLGRFGAWNATTGWELRVRVELLTLLGLDGLHVCQRVGEAGESTCEL